VDGKATKSFGTVKIGNSSAAKTFTIRNTGTAWLKGLSISKTGPDRKDFVITNLTKISLAPGASTTFKVRFTPQKEGQFNAAIHIKSNDATENPFDIELTAIGEKS
jgi:hypothetical protein